jgi:hypothetical protein
LPTDKQNIAYINKRIKVHEESAKHWDNLAKTNVEYSTLYASAANRERAAVITLEDVKHFVQTGKDRNDEAEKDN